MMGWSCLCFLVNKIDSGMHAIVMSDNIQSDASMVIYGGRGECAYTMNGAGAGICVFELCLTHALVFAMTFQFGTCPDMRICNLVSIGKRRP